VQERDDALLDDRGTPLSFVHGVWTCLAKRGKCGGMKPVALPPVVLLGVLAVTSCNIAVTVASTGAASASATSGRRSSRARRSSRWCFMHVRGSHELVEDCLTGPQGYLSGSAKGLEVGAGTVT
jgi:hypothetical protein